ncbi:MAG: hypothetical protein ABI426_10095 [Flavobacterium sp.]
MKTNFKTIGLLFAATIVMMSCSNDDNGNETIQMPTSPQQYKALSQAALDNLTQHFTMTAGTGSTTFTSSKGVKITINGNCLTLNGNPVTGNVDIKFIEVFDKGHMLATNKPTSGKLGNGNLELLISGGEFYVNATQNGQQLATTCNIALEVPTSLTGTADYGMQLFNGVIGVNGDLVWNADNPAGGGIDVGQGQGGTAGGTNYYVSFGNFGWTNVDKFYSDPRPKTTILVDAPDGYDFDNSAIYLSYDGEGQNALAKLDTYTPAGLFSEHYGQIPIGLACHIIFVTEENGQFRYGIKGVTTTANATYSFTIGETVLGTEAQLVAAINAIQ